MEAAIERARSIIKSSKKALKGIGMEKVMERVCVCGSKFVWKDSSGRYPNKKYCSSSCCRKAYRRTERVRELTREYNKRYKTGVRVWKCAICWNDILSVRKRVFCDKCRK